MLPEHEVLEVDVSPASSTRSTTVALYGEHDLTSKPQIRAALAPLQGEVLVDLSDCEFIDCSVIGVVVGKFRDLKREGHRLELLVADGSFVARVLDLVGMDEVLTVHDRRPSQG